MRLLYSALLYLLTPAILLRWLWRSRRLPAYRQRWSERFGFVPRQIPGGLWLHAVSVGELQAVAPLLEAILVEFPTLPVTVTTTTPTAATQLAARFGARIQHCYMPLDTPGAMRRAVQRLRPRLVLVVETELWPNLLHQCSQQGIPVALINARLSAKSQRGYARWPTLSKPLFAGLSAVIAQSAMDAQRLADLGVVPARLQVFGNLKYDLVLTEAMRNAARQQTQQWDATRRDVLLAASTHPGEEALLLASFTTLRKTHRELLLVLVPRHIERGNALSAAARQAGWRVSQRSTAGMQPTSEAIDVVIGDTLGELPWLLGAASLVLIGGTFVQHGGQNPLEAALWRKPIVCGPSTYNFSEIVANLEANGGLCTVSDAEQLTATLHGLLEDPMRRAALGQAAEATLAQHRGATERTLNWLRPRLKT